jgi:hypothetical protein
MTLRWTEEDLQNKLKENIDLKIHTEKPIGNAVVNVQPSIRRNKYNVSAKEDRTYNGVVYASKKEMTYYINKLEPKLQTGELDYVLRQVTFPLGADINYRADFLTLKKDTILDAETDKEVDYWLIHVYEVKGMWTDVAKLKRKLFKDQYPKITLEII